MNQWNQIRFIFQAFARKEDCKTPYLVVVQRIDGINGLNHKYQATVKKLFCRCTRLYGIIFATRANHIL